jgi:hypothetical protein
MTAQIHVKEEALARSIGEGALVCELLPFEKNNRNTQTIFVLVPHAPQHRTVDRYMFRVFGSLVQLFLVRALGLGYSTHPKTPGSVVLPIPILGRRRFG